MGCYAEQKYVWSQRKTRSSDDLEVAAKLIVPILISCLNHGDRRLQITSIQSLGRFAREPEVVVPFLVERLRNVTNDMGVRFSALEAIDDYRENAQSAVPVLLQCFQDQNSEMRNEAAIVLKHIDPKAAAKAGLN